jgi:hypothetical protein
MFNWSSYRGSLTLERSVEEDAARRRARQLSLTYWPLYEYLERRYANTVVLTFRQIEDLVGFPLPDRARTDPEWWAAACARPAEPGLPHAWTLTQRTAKPNFLAMNVVFERPFG